jgi:hypothetical protein
MRTISGQLLLPLSTETVIQSPVGVTWTSSGNNNGDFAPQLELLLQLTTIE